MPRPLAARTLVLSLLVPLGVTAWTAGATAAQEGGPSPAFVGTYHSEELGTDYRLAMEDGALWFHHRKLDSEQLTPTFPDGFIVQGSSASFTREAAGRVDAFFLSDGRVWNVRFDRVEG